MTWEELDWNTLDRLRDGFLNGSAADGPYWKSEDDLAHYDHTYAERIGWKWDHVLAELDLRGWAPPVGNVVDWGCGSGIATRRVLTRWPATLGDEGSAHFFDHSVLAETVAQRRLRETIPDVHTQTWDRTAPIGTLLISHVLNELDADSTADLREAMNRAEAVIWIEPGTSDVAGQLVVWRNAARENFRILYPCTHAAECGMFALENARHWCHHFAVPPSWIFADSNWVKFGQRAGIDLRSLPYSALVLERSSIAASAPLPEGAGRVVGRPEKFKPYARLLGCDATGLNTLTLPKRSHAALCKRIDRADSARLYTWTHDGATITQAAPFPPETNS